MARLVGGTLDLNRKLLAPPPGGCTAVPASSRPHPKFIVVAAHFEGARRLRGRFPGAWETLYGRLCPVPYKIIALQQPHEGQVLALLLSCPPKLPSRSDTRLPAVSIRDDPRIITDTLEHPITDFAVKATQTGGAARGSVTAKRPTATQAGCAVAAHRHHRHCCSFLHRRAV